MNLYADLVAFQELFVHAITLDATDRDAVLRALEAGSRRVDNMTGRAFFAETATRILDGKGRSWQWIPDLLAATTIKLDEDGDRTFELTLVAGTDYYLKRRGYKDEDALPATTLELDAINGQRGVLQHRRRLIELVGRWGFTEETETVEASGTAITGTLANASDLTLATSADADLAIGQTLKLEDEQVYISGGTTSPWTVVREVNGTTAAAHAAVAVNRYVYVPGVVTAALIIAGRLIKRRDASYANVSENLVSGVTTKFFSFDPDVDGLLSEYVRGGVA
jgi:hypothetical protein